MAALHGHLHIIEALVNQYGVDPQEKAEVKHNSLIIIVGFFYGSGPTVYQNVMVFIAFKCAIFQLLLTYHSRTLPPLAAVYTAALALDRTFNQ